MEYTSQKLQLKNRIILGIIGGLFFAITMGAFDYFNGSKFSFLKFSFNFLFFGVFISFLGKTKDNKHKA